MPTPAYGRKPFSGTLNISATTNANPEMQLSTRRETQNIMASNNESYATSAATNANPAYDEIQPTREGAQNITTSLNDSYATSAIASVNSAYGHNSDWRRDTQQHVTLEDDQRFVYDYVKP